MSDDHPRRVVVVGASLAGLRVCEGLRRGGYVGEIVVVGAEPHLPYDRPPLSKEFLAGKVDEASIALRRDDQLAALDIHFRLGIRATALDVASRTISVSDGDLLSFDRLVIATGAAPRHVPSFGELDGIVTLRTIDDAQALKDRLHQPECRLVVVGGGFLGMEVAATAREGGAHVTVVEPLETPLGRVVGPLVGNALLAEHLEHGVEVLTGVSVQAVLGQGKVEQVELSDGRVLQADTVLVAIGVRPQTDWLEDSGLVLDNGVVCDAWLSASPDIYAVGDVARWPLDLAGGLVRIEHWTNAAEQANHVAHEIVKGHDAVGPYNAVPYFWSDHFDLKIQAIGLPSADDETVVIDGTIASRRFVVCYGRGGKLVGAVGFGRPRPLMAVRKLIAERADFSGVTPLEAS